MMKKHIKKRTISRDLMAGLSLTIILIITLFGAASYFYFNTVYLNKVRAKAADITDEIAEVLSVPLWNIDTPAVQDISEAYLSSEFIAGISVKPNYNVGYEKLPNDITGVIIMKKEIVRNDLPIGTLEVMFSMESFSKVEGAIIRTALLIVLFIIIAVVLTTHFIMKRLLTRPITDLTEGLKAIAAGNYKTPLPEVMQQDINTIISEINIMAARIAERETETNRLRNLLKNIIDSMQSVLIGIQSDGTVNQWNREAEDVTGISSEYAVGGRIETVFPYISNEMAGVNRAIRSRKLLKTTRVPVSIKGEPRFWDVGVYPLIAKDLEGAVIRVDDVTERVRLEEMMLQSEKMVSVGGLAAGMAHEINNPLAGILQNMQLMHTRISENHKKNRQAAVECGTTISSVRAYMEKRELLRMMDSITESGKRAANIVENMLSFSRKSTSNFKAHNIADLLEKTVDLASNDYDLKRKYDFRKIEIIREYDSRLPEVTCEGVKIQQVFLNILKNGAQAMGEHLEKTKTPRFHLRTKKRGETAHIEIEDNGPGMDETARKRIFEPFYTTKPAGVGTGLGLSVSYFIITEDHAGSMAVYSSPGNGAKFVITIPIKRSASGKQPDIQVADS